MDLLMWVTLSLTRGWGCSFLLLLSLVSKVYLRTESCRNQGHILLSQYLESPNLGLLCLLWSSRLFCYWLFIFSLVWQFLVSSWGVPSLMRGWVCNLQCNYSLVRVTQDPKPCITVSSETPPTWRARYPYLYPSGIRSPSYSLGTGFHFRRLLQLAGLLWLRYSNAPPCRWLYPHAFVFFKFSLYCNQRSVGQFFLVLGPQTRFVLLSDICGVAGHPPWGEAGSVIYSHNSLSLSCPSPAELMTTSYSRLRLPKPGGPGPCICIPQEQGDPVIPPGTGFPYCHFLWLTELQWWYSNPPPYRYSESDRTKCGEIFCLLQSRGKMGHDCLKEMLCSWYLRSLLFLLKSAM
jgi:hypothetical protein